MWQILKLKQNWEKRIAKSLNTMCTELNIPLAKSRGDKEAQDLAGHWNEIGTMELGEHSMRLNNNSKKLLLLNLKKASKNTISVSGCAASSYEVDCQFTSDFVIKTVNTQF